MPSPVQEHSNDQHNLTPAVVATEVKSESRQYKLSAQIDLSELSSRMVEKIPQVDFFNFLNQTQTISHFIAIKNSQNTQT